ncbi:MAG: hypothetical protein K0S35_2116 [Geminicoccaceae bacterium]|jgi:hypothetical protein|nr:hypothetical protein [Geminicoccaceae bacterium]
MTNGDDLGEARARLSSALKAWNGGVPENPADEIKPILDSAYC